MAAPLPVLGELDCLYYFLAAIVFLFLAAVLHKLTHAPPSFFDSIPGPPSPSLLAGNMLELSTTGAGTLPLEWRNTYHDNTVIRIHGPYFAGDGIFVSDPTALWKIYDANASFVRPPSMTALGERLVGKGIILAEGNTHYRMKRIMQKPAFNAANVRNMLPHFRHGALALVEAWGELLDSHTDFGVTSPKAPVDVFDWLGCSALDMIGSAAFGMKLGAVSRRQGADNISDLANAYESVLGAMGAEETAVSIFIRYSPPWIINILTLIPNELMKAVKHSMSSAASAARVVIQDRMESIRNGEALTNDALTLMVRANLDEDAKLRLSDSEMTSQITSIMFAGHGTSAAFMSWSLYQLAIQPELQDRVREEILSNAHCYDTDQDANIFSEKNMPLFDMFVKEVMRFYPVVHFNERMAAVDTVLKLSRPLVLKDGTAVNELPCPKGTIVYADIVSYNYSTAIFGPDANKFRPERWSTPFEAKMAPSVYAGLFNFVAGPKWRFLILEAQVTLFELVRNYKFYPNGSILKRMQMAMVPAVVKDQKQVLGMPLLFERVRAE